MGGVKRICCLEGKCDASNTSKASPYIGFVNKSEIPSTSNLIIISCIGRFLSTA